MRKFWRWTVIFRGNLFRNLNNMFKVLWNVFRFITISTWYIIRIPMVLSFKILGINWLDFERKIYRSIRIYFT